MKKFTNALMLGAISIATVVAMSGCGNDKEPEKAMAITPIEKIESGNFHFSDTVILSVTDAPVGGGITYQCDNEWVAAISGDTLFGKHIGEAVITATAGTQKAIYNVKVTPRYTMATEPLWDWNCTPAELKAKKGTEPAGENEGSIFYSQNAEKGIYEAYIFKENKLIASALQIQITSKEMVNEYLYFALERYQAAGMSQDKSTIYFCNAATIEEATMVLLVYQNQNSLIIEYQPNSQKSNAPALMPAKKGMPLFR